MEPIVTLQRREKIDGLLNRVNYKSWTFRSGFMGNGCYIQCVLDAIDGKGDNWTGRKWHVSNFATDSEIISTAFKAIMTAEERETREQFLFDSLAIYGPHQSL